MLAQVSDGKLQFGGLFDRFKVNVDEYKEIIESFKQLDLNSKKFIDRSTGKTNWDKVAKSIKGCDKTALSYFKTLDDGKGTINNQSASVEGLSAYLKKSGQMYSFAAVKATLFNMALNAGIMLAATVAIKLLVQALDNAADSLEDVESRIQNNKTALSDYTSKIDINPKALYKLHYNSVSYRVLLYSKYLIMKGCDNQNLEITKYTYNLNTQNFY